METADNLLMDSLQESNRAKPIHLNRELRQLNTIDQSRSVQNILHQNVSYNTDNSKFLDFVQSEQHDLKPSQPRKRNIFVKRK